MFKRHKFAPALLIAAGLFVAAPACAQTGFYRYERDHRDYDRYAYENGYREGLEHGEADGRRGRSFDYAHDDDYREADHGYRGSYGGKEAYRRAFRQGYVDGYSEGYRGYRRDDDHPRRNYPTYPTFPPYPSGPTIYQRGGFSPAAQIGYQDGYEVGRNDARDRESYDPRRSKRYRAGDHDYNDRYGSRDQYKREYRDAFQQGYEQGYRDSRW